MNKYQQYLNSEQSEDTLLESLFEFVKSNDLEAARFVAARIQAIRDIKWELKKLDETRDN